MFIAVLTCHGCTTQCTLNLICYQHEPGFNPIITCVSEHAHVLQDLFQVKVWQSLSDDVYTTVLVRSATFDAEDCAKMLAEGKRNLLCGEVPQSVNQLQEVCRLLYVYAKLQTLHCC